jgi:DNA-binding transcriptional LysR family regulator
VDDLNALPKIAFKSYRESHYRWRLFETEKSLEMTFQPQAVVNDMTALLEMVKAGAGIALTPVFVSNPYLADGSLQHILPQLRGEEATFYLVYLKREHLPRKTRLLIDFFMDCANRESALFDIT